MADVTNLIAYYANLLILQYNGLSKAQATIELIASTIIGDGLIIDVQNAYDLDTAVGKQLDVLGKYEGVTRFFSEIELIDYFGLVTYAQYLSLPSSPPVFGFSIYSNFNDYSYNGTYSYYDNNIANNALGDNDFRPLVKYMARLNRLNFSEGEIDQLMFAVFGALVRPETTSNMEIVYFIDSNPNNFINAVIAKKLLPNPMGVLVFAVTGVTGAMFSFTDYSDYESPFGYGFSTYANYGSLAGQVLTYDQIEVQ